MYGTSPSRPEPPKAVAQWSLPAGAAGAESARARLEETLTEWGRAPLIPTATLCATELLGSLGGAAGSEVVLAVTDHGDTVEVGLDFVGDASPVRAAMVDGTVGTAPHLTVVDRCAALWGVVPLGGGERVWFEIST